MKWLISFLASSLLLFGCVNKESMPEGIIKKDSMQIILWDMMQADQYSKQYLEKDSLKIDVKLETMKLYQAVFQIHHITKEAFQKSYQYYIAHPDLTKSMFDSLSSHTNIERQELYKLKQPNAPKPLVKPVTIPNKHPSIKPPTVKHLP